MNDSNSAAPPLVLDAPATPAAHRLLPLWLGGAALVLLPFALRAMGLTLDTATVVVILTMATLGLNLLVGTTGLVSFGHSAWFGIGGYAAALAQKHWFPGQMFAPLLFCMAFVALREFGAHNGIVGVDLQPHVAGDQADHAFHLARGQTDLGLRTPLPKPV